MPGYADPGEGKFLIFNPQVPCVLHKDKLIAVDESALSSAQSFVPLLPGLHSREHPVNGMTPC